MKITSLLQSKSKGFRNINSEARNFFKHSIIITCIFFGTSCKKAVEVSVPQTLIVGSDVYKSNSSAAAVLTGLYSNSLGPTSGFAGGFAGISCYSGLYSDELQYYSKGNIAGVQYYTNSLLNNSTSFWGGMYNGIYVCNAAIEGLTQSTGLTAAVKQQLIGEAKFCRGFIYLYAVNFFGNVPLITTTNYQVNATASNASPVQVYQQIIADLQDAENLLSSNYLASDAQTNTIERTRPTKWAAAALLARVYLYYGNLSNTTANYANAEAQATTVINNSSYSLSPLTGNSSVFKSNSSEAIWQLQPTSNPNDNTLDGNTFILTAAPGSSSISLSSNLLNAFEPGDNRRLDWVDSITVQGKTYYYPYKYRVKTGSTLTEYNMMLRLGEQYLIRAEARAQQGETAQAISDLNIIRNRAGLPNYNGNTDQASLLVAIFHERQVELFTELGHRFFDLKRSGTINTVMDTIAVQKGGTWNADKALFPIPNSDILNDHNLKQNPGY